MIPHMGFLFSVTIRRRMHSVLRKWIAVGVLALVACGKRGDPKPPIPLIPKATSDLVVTQRGPKVILAWSYPSLTVAGKSLPSFRRVVVYRHVDPLPAPSSGEANSSIPASLDKAIPHEVALFAKIPPISPTHFNKVKERLDSIEKSKLPSATVGAKLTNEDAPEFRTRDGRPVRLTYAVVTEGESARSDVSNLALIVPVDVPVAPQSLTAEAKPQGVVLTWVKPTSTLSGSDKPFTVGYNVYRTSAAGAEDLGNPVNAAPEPSTTYTDTPPYGAYAYRVTAVALSSPRIESDPTAAATATFKDLMPPPVPTNVAALVETKSIRLVWDPVQAPDLAGYLIYRWEGAAKLKLTPSPVTATYYRDVAPDAGIGYAYGVTSIDKSGNESAPARTPIVLVPKTP
jgi:hypothetical protein